MHVRVWRGPPFLSFLNSKPCISLKIDEICSKQHALEGLAWTVMRDVEIPFCVIIVYPCCETLGASIQRCPMPTACINGLLLAVPGGHVNAVSGASLRCFILGCWSSNTQHKKTQTKKNKNRMDWMVWQHVWNMAWYGWIDLTGVRIHHMSQQHTTSIIRHNSNPEPTEPVCSARMASASPTGQLCVDFHPFVVALLVSAVVPRQLLVFQLTLGITWHTHANGHVTNNQ
jgi:hypothetical protein